MESNPASILHELEDFVYLVSHDMAAPQRHVREFTKLLLATLENNLSDEQKIYRGYIEDGLQKIERMQSALLQLSRVITEGKEFSTFPLLDCLTNVVQALQDKIHAKNAIICLPDTDVRLTGDQQQIETVFMVLLDNSLTFTREYVAPEIKICADMSDKEISISIDDNGIGISSEHADKVFTMFRRLHKFGEYGDGIGAGLAIAKKIVSRHGGNISILSKDKGSVFVVRFLK